MDNSPFSLVILLIFLLVIFAMIRRTALDRADMESLELDRECDKQEQDYHCGCGCFDKSDLESLALDRVCEWEESVSKKEIAAVNAMEYNYFKGKV